MGARIEGWLLDQALIPFVECDSQEESERLLDYLLQSCAQPIIREIVNRKLGVFSSGSGDVRQDIEDVSAEINLRLLVRLNDLKVNSRSITDFKAYVAVTAYNTVHEYLRRRFPNRHGLKNKLRYLISRDARFEVWQERSGEWGCGFAEWKLSVEATMGSDLIGIEMLEKMEIRKGSPSDRPAGLIAAIFESAGSPIELDSLVTYIAGLWNVRDVRPARFRAMESGELETVSSDSGRAGNESDDRLFLKQVWGEIKELPVRQRLALLLNLSDRQGWDSIGLLPAIGVASVREIAAVLQIDPERFALLW
ncbi:MAG: hypothetical protein ACREAC_04970, partial [Blastocatellia bacterium]